MGGMKIETNIPIPSGRGRENGLAATFRKMKVGNSVVFIGGVGGVFTTAKLAGIKVTTRKEAAGGVRIWRIK